MKKESLSIIVPCYNEEGNVQGTINSLMTGLAGIIDDFEIILIDDCSADQTREIIKTIAQQNKYVRPVYNEVNKGFGGSVKMSYELVSKKYVVTFGGDNCVGADSIRNICSHIGDADLVISYLTNSEVRGMGRTYLSRLYTWIMNRITGHNLHYYNGNIILKTSSLANLEYFTHGFALQSTLVAQLLWRNCSYIELPISLLTREYGSTSAFKFKNIVSVIKALITLYRRSSALRNPDSVYTNKKAGRLN